MKKENIRNKILCIAFMCYIGITAWLNRNVLLESLQETKSNNGKFQDFVETMEEKSLSEFQYKEQYIDINGGFVKSLGGITNNEVIILDNGMLTDKTITWIDVTEKSERVEKLYHFLSEQKIPFVYVQAPYKVDINNAVLPIGTVNYANDNATRMLDELKRKKVPVLDLRPYISVDDTVIEQYFYKTDHHWNAYGSFFAFQLISEYVQDIFPEQGIMGDAQNIDMWELHVQEKWFLGSHGKRVGRYFCGVDDLLWLTPRFETSVTCEIAGKKSYEGDFEVANLRMDYVAGIEPEYYENNPYCIYIGGDYGLVRHKNNNAPSDLEVLIVKDSYSLPVQAYFSTIFKSLDVIDLRYYKEESLVDYIGKTNPDIVIMMYYPKSLDVEKFFEFGLD